MQGPFKLWNDFVTTANDFFRIRQSNDDADARLYESLGKKIRSQAEDLRAHICSRSAVPMCRPHFSTDTQPPHAWLNSCIPVSSSPIEPKWRPTALLYQFKALNLEWTNGADRTSFP
jgi:hypothetical protein